MMPTVLFVDDDALLLEGLGRTLAREPYKRLFASSASEALEILRKEPVTVLVTDDQMPGMPGSELVAQVREDFPWVLPLLMTGQATIGSIVHALNHGQVFRVLLKPFRGEELISVVRVALAHQAVWSRCREALPILRRLGSLLDGIDRSEQVMDRAPALEPRGAAGQQVVDLGELAAALDAELEWARGLIARRGDGAG